MFYYVYLLQSENKFLYIGYTTNLRKRILIHNAGTSFFTKRGKNWKIVYAEAYTNSSDARAREKFLKSGRGREVLKKQLGNTLSGNWQSADSAD